MGESEESSEAEPLVPREHIRRASKITPLHVSSQRFVRDPKSLELVTIFVVAFDTQHGQ